METNKRRIGIDSNILVDGILSEWSYAKGILILAVAQVFTLVLTEPVVSEVESALADRAQGPEDYRRLQEAYRKLLSKCRLERHPAPDEAEINKTRQFLPALRHSNDLPVLASILEVRPDWFVSDNNDHFGPKLAKATGLNILTGFEFLRQLIVPAPPGVVS